MAKSVTAKNKTDEELCQIIANSVTDIVRDSLNSTFRQTYFDTIKVILFFIVICYNFNCYCLQITN